MEKKEIKHEERRQTIQDFLDKLLERQNGSLYISMVVDSKEIDRLLANYDGAIKIEERSYAEADNSQSYSKERRTYRLYNISDCAIFQAGRQQYQMNVTFSRLQSLRLRRRNITVRVEIVPV